MLKLSLYTTLTNTSKVLGGYEFYNPQMYVLFTKIQKNDSVWGCMHQKWYYCSAVAYDLFYFMPASFD